MYFEPNWYIYSYLEADLVDENKQYSRNGYFCLIYTGYEENRLQNIQKIFHRLFDLYVLNINIFVAIESVPYVLTYFPFTPKKCHSSEPEFYLSFRDIPENGEYTLAKAFFPNKVVNMHGCQLLILTWENRPFIILESQNDSPSSFHMRGIEGRLLTVLATAMNFSMKLLLSAAKDPGTIDDNGVATGATKMIMDGKANITIANFLYDKKRAEMMTAAHSYASYPMVVLIPRGSALSPFVRLTMPFKYIIWSCICTSVLIGVLVILCLKAGAQKQGMAFVLGQRNYIAVSNLFSVLLGGLVAINLPKRNFARYLLAVWLLYTLVLRNAYIGQLFLILQDGRPRNTLRTISETVSGDYTFYTFPVLKAGLLDVAKTTNMEFIDRTKNSVPHLIDRLVTGDVKFVMTVLEATARSYNKQNWKERKRVNILPEKLFTTPITFYMPKHSYLKHHINDLILRTIAAGLTSKYEDLYLDSNMDHYRPRNEPVNLSLALLSGLFGFYFILLLFASFVFMLELLSKRSNFVKRGLDFFNC